MKRLLLLVPLLLAGCGTPLTPSRVAPSFREVFVGLYAQQQQLLRREAVGKVDPLAACRRTGTDADGPGEDWVCSVQYVDLGTSSAQVFELQVKPDGCWKATGPPATQPAQLVDPVSSRPRTNPLSEFDGCLDTGW
ncbi:MAG: uncharacterized protein JWO22_1801 [Frankiales bacterium]|nr:uncharacterized protein [Frankiales bacterium]